MHTFNIVNSHDSRSKIIINEENPWKLKYRQLKSQLTDIKKMAYNEGYLQCKNELEADYQQKMLSEHQEVEKFKNETITLCNNFYEQLQQQIKSEIVKLSLKIAEKIVSEKLADDNDITKNAIGEIIENVTDFTDATIFVSADTHVYLMKNGLDYLPPDLIIKVDSRLNKGDCRLESPSGIIDASIASRLKIIKEKLFSNLNEI